MQDLVVGIDIGGTNTAFGLVNRQGEILVQDTIKTSGETVAEYVATLKVALLRMLKQTDRASIAGIGVGAPNANFYTGEIADAANLRWKGIIPLARLLTESLGLKTTLTNDANAAAIGEMTYGAARNMKDFILVTLGTGVGSGFVSNGQLIYGHDGFAGELGHIIAVRDGRMCGCGRKGCLVTYASASGMVRTATEWLLQTTEETTLRKLGNSLTSKDVQLAASGNDAFALRIFDYTGRILGQCLADVVAITSPQAIIFFGGLAKAGELLLGPTHQYMEANLLSIYRNKVSFVQSALPASDAAILGASALAWQA